MAETKTTTTPTTIPTLTLAQKFVKLREAIPEITQKKHSPNVKYKFAKIFDIYELLTPAMNEYGVNFDIVGEKATRHHDNDDEMYYHYYEQKTQSGTRIVWVYEADLTIRWTNADDPEDTLEVTLHAIGTNDGGPDKAKGSAWTYALKYYFFEKFGIDQGEDDPDNQNLGDGVTSLNGAGNKSTPARTQNATGGATGAKKGLSDAQIDRMYKKGEAAGVTKEQILQQIAKAYGQQDPHNMTRGQYDELCKTLDELATTGGNKK